MAYFASNGVIVGPDYLPGATFPQQGAFSDSWVKMDAFINLTDVLVQLMEEPGGWMNDRSEEILLRQGFQSVPVVTPFVAVRFRIWEGTQLNAQTGTVDFRLFA